MTRTDNKTPVRPSSPPNGIAIDFDPVSSIEDIQRLDQEFWEVTKGLTVRTGSVLRVPSSHYKDWGIKITDENRDELKKISQGYRKKDAREKEDDGKIERIERTATNLQHKERMTIDIAKGVVEAMRSMMDHEEINIAVIPSSRGSLADMIYYGMLTDDELKTRMDRVKLHLVDLSQKKLADTPAKMLDSVDTRTYPIDDEMFLKFAGKEKFDIVASLCHFSKKSFKTEYFELLSGSIRSGGALVSGDWHSIFANRPLYTFELLQAMNVDRKRLEKMRDIFGKLLGLNTQTSLMIDEMNSLAHHGAHWIEVWRKMPEIEARSARPPRVYFLGAYDTSRERRAALTQCGFSLDADDIRRAFPRSMINPTRKMMRDVDRAAVHFALKK